MRIRKKKWAPLELENCDYYIKNPQIYKNKWRTLFSKNGELHIDLGCGKGVFLTQIAKENKNINYIGVDLSIDILGVARRNIAKQNFTNKINNIILTKYNIEFIDEIFGVKDEIDKIYIYFCNPWPRKRHNKRRLTYHNQLIKYKTFLKIGGEIEFKTDDLELYNDTKRYLILNNFEIIVSTSDLYKKNISTFKTEHEQKFLKEEKEIKYIKAINISK